MSGWLLLSDADGPLRPDLPTQLDRGSLVMELALPLPTGVLLDWHEGTAALSLFHHPNSGLALLRRQGTSVWRHRLAGPLPTGLRRARLVLRWDAARPLWALRLEDVEGRGLAEARGVDAVPLPLAPVQALCRGGGPVRRDAAVLWFGLADSPAPLPNRAWIGRTTPVPTLAGAVLAGHLRPGDQVLTRDAGPVQVRAVHPVDMPSRGSHAAVLLRAPYFARRADLLVSASQRVLLDGPEVEYLFGEGEVLVGAGLLADGHAALVDARRPTVQGIALDLGGARLIDIDGCTLACGGAAPAALRVLDDYEAAPLLSLLRRMRPRAA